MRTAELLAGGDVPGTVWVGTTHHHLTYGRVAGLPEDVGYLHIDNHTDDFLRPAEEPGETVRTSRFTDQIRSSGRDVGYLGAYGPEAPSLDRRQTHDWEEGVWKGFMEQLPERLYVSVDMDVFDRSVYSATHSQGYLTMETFDEVCGWLDEHREVVAADIIHLDHSPPERNLEPYGRVIDRLLDICSV